MDGFKATQEEIQWGVTQEITRMVVGVMRPGAYSQRMAAEALLRSLGKTQGSDRIEDTVFYRVCAWLTLTPARRDSLQSFATPGALVTAIAKTTAMRLPSVRSCLASHPFALPERLRPVKHTKKAKALPTPPQPTFVPAPRSALKPLDKVSELLTLLYVLGGPEPYVTRAQELVQALFAEEIAEIKRRLADD